MEELKTSAYDCPDERDYDAELIEQWGGDLPKKVMLFNTPFQNQLNTQACSCFTAWHLGTELDRLDKAKFYDWFELWKEWLKRWASNTDGWNNTACLKMMIELWIIWGYAVAKWPNGIMKALANNRWWFFWTNKCDWRKTWETGVFTYTENWAWHFFAVLGYDMDKQVLFAKNSWWKEWWPKGWIFEIPFNMIDKLFTTYVVYDKKDKPLIDNYKQKIMDNIEFEWAKKLFEAWIWNWTNPKNNMNRQEVMQVLYRVIEKIEKWEKIIK